MADNQIQIGIGGDASGLKIAAADAGQIIQGLVVTMGTANSAAAGLGKALDGALKAPPTAKALSDTLSSVGAAAATGVAQARSVLGGQLADLNAQIKIALDKANTQAVISKSDLQAKMQAVRASAQQGDISPTAELAALQSLANAEVAAETAKADAIYQINRQALADKEVLLGAGSLGARKAADEELVLAQQHEDQLTRIADQGALEREKIDEQALAQQRQRWNATINPMVQAWSQGMLEMAEGTKSFSQVMQNIGRQILQDFVTKVIDPMIEHWILHEAEKTGITSAESGLRKAIQSLESLFGITAAKTEAIAGVGSNAAVAGSAATASAAAIPVVGWAIAPEAGAAAAGAALGFSSLIVAAGGLGDVPFDNMPALLHRNETVLPASIANPLRGMLSNYRSAAGGASLGGGGAAAVGGDIHLHMHNGPGSDGASIQRFFDQHGDKLMRTLNGKLRGGSKLAVA